MYPASTDLQQAQIAAVRPVYLGSLLAEHEIRTQTERHTSCNRDCQNQAITVLGGGQMGAGKTKAARFAAAEQRFPKANPNRSGYTPDVSQFVRSCYNVAVE
jgi:hypothetical protein